MEGRIDADAPLDYAEFQILSSQNRYEAYVCSGNKVETVASGSLEQLLLHSPEVKGLYSKGSNTSFRIQPPETLHGAKWFTKSILTRFLHIVESPDILDVTNAIEIEISQLEEARRFQLSLIVKAEVDTVSSDASKNELLRAMDLRLTALREELTAALSRAAGTSCSPKEITDLVKFSHYFRAINMRDFLRKFIELTQKGQSVYIPSDNKSLFKNDSRQGSVTERSTSMPKLIHSDTPVKYGVSPAKVAQIERESSSGSEDEASFSSEEDQTLVERSRALVRSASPRRSASPMRRVQIGRSGSRRAGSLTIKSLNYFPRVASHRDAAVDSSEEEGSELPSRKSDTHAKRISVQDAINLFESRQRDQTVDTQKTKLPSLNPSINANKSVLRRWSSGTGESSAQCLPDIISENSIPASHNTLVGVDASTSFQQAQPESFEMAEIDVKSDTSGKGSSKPGDIPVDPSVMEGEGNAEKITASAEWSRQKEAELNQLLMKMMESKPVKYQNTTPNNVKSKNVAGEQRGGFYDHYKQKRDEKLRGEVAGKRAEKEAQFKAMQQFLDEKKAEMVAPPKISEVGRRHTAAKPQKPHKNLSQLVNPTKETLKPAVVKKASSKASPLPATRKSWPSTPSPRTTGTSPAGTPSTGTTPTRRKSQSTSSVPRSNPSPKISPKVERSNPRPKTVKATQNDSNKSIKGVKEKKQQTTPRNVKTAKTKVQITTSEDHTSTAKPSFYSKVTRKSSVVPLESKPFLRKGSGIGPGVGLVVVKTKVSSQPEESLRKSEDLIQAEEKEAVVNSLVLVGNQQEREIKNLETDVDIELETQVISPHLCEVYTESSNQVDSFNTMAESVSKPGDEEESIISASAWGEIEEYREHSSPQIESSATASSHVEISSQRVRHSLSQMLLEENSEPEITEWGNAENPPAMVYQRDAPKGLKRLLKFARKSKTDAHLTGWSSPSAFSEGEDDAEESKNSKRSADNLLRKSALHGKNHGQQKTTSYEPYDKNSVQSNLSNSSTQSSYKLQQDNISASVTATKATRSFFSLSAFRGSKPS